MQTRWDSCNNLALFRSHKVARTRKIKLPGGAVTKSTEPIKFILTLLTVLMASNYMFLHQFKKSPLGGALYR
jgi:hypothetical protein